MAAPDDRPRAGPGARHRPSRHCGALSRRPNDNSHRRAGRAAMVARDDRGQRRSRQQDPLPVEVRIIPTYKVAADLGFIDSYPGLVLPLIASATATLLFRQVFLTVPDELVEA